MIYLFFIALVHAQNVTVTPADTFCKIEVQHKACKSLNDAADVKINSFEGCKQRALAKGQACLKADGKLEKVVLKGKFTEKLSVSSSTQNYVCDVHRSGTSSCL